MKEVIKLSKVEEETAENSLDILKSGLAVVVRVKPDHGEVEWACYSLEEAFQYVNEHQKDLHHGERYDIYYKGEEGEE